MLKLFFSVCIGMFLLNNVYAQKPVVFSRIKITVTNDQLNRLLQKGVSFDEASERNGAVVTGDFSAADIAIIKKENIKITYVINDLAEDFKIRNKAAAADARVMAATSAVPPGFNYGSMGGYYTFAEMERELDSLKLVYPGLITTKVSLGNSLEGRPIWMIKISDNPDVDENEPEVFLNGLVHAREAISMANLIYFMQYILANYQTDPELNCLINNREIYIVPCINPDGYVYNQTTNPSGGGTWRKNRRNNGDGTFGVDINRNFGFNWGYDNTGSSPMGSSDSYRGTAAFSEPETQAIRNFCLARRFGTTINHHSYANTFNTPWGYVNQATPDNTHYMKYGELAKEDNTLAVGTSYQNLGYVLNGGANDWMYGEQTTKNKIFAAVVETGTSSDGFWPVQSRIIPLNKSNLRLNINACWAAGSYFKPVIPSGAASASGQSYALPVRVTNYGLSTGELAETVSFSTTDTRVTSVGAPVTLYNLPSDGELNTSITLAFAASATPGIIQGTLNITTRDGCVLQFPCSFNYTGNCSALPAGWSTTAVGSVGIAGGVCYQAPTFTMFGSGIGLTGSSDQYQLLRTTISGNYTIIARVASVQNTASGAKAGIVITESTSTGSRRVSLCVVPSTGRIEFQSRKTTGGKVTTTATATGAAPRWLKLTRNGNMFTAYYSANGTTWTTYASASVTMATAVTAGLAVTSGSNSVLHTATFDNVNVASGILAKEGEFERLPNKTGVSLFPNPVMNSNAIIQFIGVTKETAQLRVTDIAGRLVILKNVAVQEGTNTISLDNISSLKSGSYQVSIIGTKINLKTQFVKL
jgi:regulation of enolase protein 1 (concanavalin A-like superfamily)